MVQRRVRSDSSDSSVDHAPRTAVLFSRANQSDPIYSPYLHSTQDEGSPASGSFPGSSSDIFKFGIASTCTSEANPASCKDPSQSPPLGEPLSATPILLPRISNARNHAYHFDAYFESHVQFEPCHSGLSSEMDSCCYRAPSELIAPSTFSSYAWCSVDPPDQMDVIQNDEVRPLANPFGPSTKMKASELLKLDNFQLALQETSSLEVLLNNGLPEQEPAPNLPRAQAIGCLRRNGAPLNSDSSLPAESLSETEVDLDELDMWGLTPSCWESQGPEGESLVLAQRSISRTRKGPT